LQATPPPFLNEKVIIFGCYGPIFSGGPRLTGLLREKENLNDESMKSNDYF
jgi:hypothetical protein